MDTEDIIPRSLCLQMFQLRRIPKNCYEMLPLCGIGVAESFNVFLAFHNQTYFASCFLRDAALPEDEVDKQPVERYKYLQAAILAYYSSTDYIYQIIYFYFELYGEIHHENILSRKDIIRLSKSIRGNVIEQIDAWLNKDERTADFLKKFNDLKEFLSRLKENAIEIKHRGRYHIEGLFLERSAHVKKIVHGVELDFTEITTPQCFDIEDEIDYLKEVHNRIYQMQDTIYRFLDYQGRLDVSMKAQGANIT